MRTRDGLYLAMPSVGWKEGWEKRPALIMERVGFASLEIRRTRECQVLSWRRVEGQILRRSVSAQGFHICLLTTGDFDNNKRSSSWQTKRREVMVRAQATQWKMWRRVSVGRLSSSDVGDGATQLTLD